MDGCDIFNIFQREKNAESASAPLERSSNFELRRIIATLAIIAYHFFLQAPINAPKESAAYLIGAVLGSFGRAGVNIFVMIGAWFLIDAKFKSIPIIRLYLTTFIYMAGLTFVISFLQSQNAEKSEIFRNILHAVIPFSSSALWLVTCYITLLLLAPFLNILIDHLSSKRYAVLVAVLLLLFVLMPAVLNLVPGYNIYERYIIKAEFYSPLINNVDKQVFGVYVIHLDN